MKKLLGLFNLFLCFELIVAPVAPQMSLLPSETYAADCPAGLHMDTVLNRCLTSVETANVMNATASCASGDVECYKSNAQNAFQAQVNDGKAPERKENNGFVSTVANAGAVAGAVMVAATMMSNQAGKGNKCKSYSFWGMLAGSAALIVGDNLANMQHKGRLKKIQEDWGKIVNPEEANGDKDKERTASIEAQSQSFEMLARAEDSMAKAASMKKTFFMVAALSYGVATVVSGLEIIAENTDISGSQRINNFCKIAPKDIDASQHTDIVVKMEEHHKSEGLFQKWSNGHELLILPHQFYKNIQDSENLVSLILNRQESEQTHSSPTLEYYESVNKALGKESATTDPVALQMIKDIALTVVSNLNPIPNSHAVETNAAKSYKEDKSKGINVGGLAIGAAAGAAGAAFGKNLITPITRLGFSAVMAGLSTTMAMHAGSQAKASKKRAELLRKMRDDFITADAALNACKSDDRNDPNKPTCYCYTAENARNTNRTNSNVCNKLWSGLDLASSSYTGTNESSLICVNNQYQADASCACKQSKSCMKAGVGGISGISTGTMSMLGQSLAPLNSIASGSTDAANVSMANLENNAAKMNALAKQLERKPAVKAALKNKDKKSAALIADLTQAGASMPSSGLGSSGFSMPSNPGEASRMLEKELTSNAPTSIGGGDTLSGPGNNNNSNPELEFGLTNDQLNAQESQIAELMKENLDFGGNDINPGSKTNIFEVLSNRYQRSGMRRLFDEKGVTKPDAAAKTDVNQ